MTEAVTAGETDECPSCRASRMTVFFESTGLPVHSMLLLKSREEALAVERGDMRLSICESCGFIANTAFDPSRVDYFGDYESSQAFSPTFNAFALDSAKGLVERFGLKGKRVTEIGCGAGDYLDLLCQQGIGSGTGIDPAPASESIQARHSDRLTFIHEPYSPALFKSETDLILCRMTLEHIPNVRKFVSLAYEGSVAAGGCPVVFQVPDAERVFEDVAFWDVYYEHCSYFTRESLTRLFEMCGFQVNEALNIYDGQYLWIEAEPATGTRAQSSPEAAESVAELQGLVDGYALKCEEMTVTWQRRIRDEAASGRKFVLWGGGSKGVAFVNALHLGEELDCLVDINPAKQEKYVAGSGHLIVGSESLKDRRPDHVLVMNPVYLHEIKESLAAMGVKAEVTAL